MKVPTIESLLEDQLKDLYSAESQLMKALPRMAKAASSPELKDAIESHLDETRTQAERLEQIGELMEFRVSGKKCKAMEGLIEEGKEVLEMEAPPAIVDAAIIAAAQRVEHYEISGYGTARALAQHLGHDQVVELLSASLEEESDADSSLTSICEEHILPAVETDTMEEDEDVTPSKRRMAVRK